MLMMLPCQRIQLCDSQIQICFEKQPVSRHSMVNLGEYKLMSVTFAEIILFKICIFKYG